MNGNPAHLAFAFAAGLVLAALLGIAAAWWLHRRTMLSAWNIYLAWALTCPVALAAMASGGKPAAAGAVGLVTTTAAALAARRWRLGALGAGGELRQYERARVMAWRARPARDRNRRVYIAGQGELVRERAWPPSGELRRDLDQRLVDQHRDRIEVGGVRLEAQALGLEWDGSATCERVEDRRGSSGPGSTRSGTPWRRACSPRATMP